MLKLKKTYVWHRKHFWGQNRLEKWPVCISWSIPWFPTHGRSSPLFDAQTPGNWHLVILPHSNPLQGRPEEASWFRSWRMSRSLPGRSSTMRISGFQVERNSMSKGWEAENIRGLLRICVQSYVTGEYGHERRLERGGGQDHVSAGFQHQAKKLNFYPGVTERPSEIFNLESKMLWFVLRTFTLTAVRRWSELVGSCKQAVAWTEAEALGLEYRGPWDI